MNCRIMTWKYRIVVNTAVMRRSPIQSLNRSPASKNILNQSSVIVRSSCKKYGFSTNEAAWQNDAGVINSNKYVNVFL